MGAGRTLGRLAAVGAAIAGVIFFWRKRQAAESTDNPADEPTPPTASDTP